MFKKIVFFINLISLIALTALPVWAISDDVQIRVNVTNVNAPVTPPVTPPGGGGGPLPDRTPPIIYDIFVTNLYYNSATIVWKTNERAVCQIFWGETADYEKGGISETTFYLNHFTDLNNLLPATNYHFKISCKDTNQNEGETADQQFSTLILPDTTPPANVLELEAIPGDSQITLKWKNPPDLDFKAVKILRSTIFYPKNPEEGILIYDGIGEPAATKVQFIDTGLKNGSRYFYTLFAYDKAGNYASGAIASAIPQAPKKPPAIKPPAVPPEIPPLIPPEKIPPEILKELEKLTLKDFKFSQENKILKIINGEVKIKADIPLTITVDYKKIPEIIKTIIIALDKKEGFLSFLFQSNLEKTQYFTTFILPEIPKIYPFNINLFNYQNQTLQKIPGKIKVFKAVIKPPEKPKVLKKIEEKVLSLTLQTWFLIKVHWLLWLIILVLPLLLLILLLLLLLLLRKRKKKAEKEKIKNNSGDKGLGIDINI